MSEGKIAIHPMVALEEAAQLAEFYRNRNLLNAQARHDLAAANQELSGQVTDLTARVEAFLADPENAVVEPEA